MNAAAAKTPIVGLDAQSRDDVRHAVNLAAAYWPNANDDRTPREYIRSAFKMLRSHTAYHFGDLYAGIGAVERDAYRYYDM